MHCLQCNLFVSRTFLSVLRAYVCIVCKYICERVCMFHEHGKCLINPRASRSTERCAWAGTAWTRSRGIPSSRTTSGRGTTSERVRPRRLAFFFKTFKTFFWGVFSFSPDGSPSICYCFLTPFPKRPNIVCFSMSPTMDSGRKFLQRQGWGGVGGEEPFILYPFTRLKRRCWQER